MLRLVEKRYWAIPLSALGAFMVTFLWDLADGPDDVPPWVEDCDE